MPGLTDSLLLATWPIRQRYVKGSTPGQSCFSRISPSLISGTYRASFRQDKVSDSDIVEMDLALRKL